MATSDDDDEEELRWRLPTADGCAVTERSTSRKPMMPKANVAKGAGRDQRNRGSFAISQRRERNKITTRRMITARRGNNAEDRGVWHIERPKSYSPELILIVLIMSALILIHSRGDRR